MAVVLIKLFPKERAGAGGSAQEAQEAQAAASVPAIPATSAQVQQAAAEIPGTFSTVKRENAAVNRLLWAAIGSAATLLLVAVFGRSKN